jgi:hypothetical protein
MPRRHRNVLGCLSHIGRLSLRQIHAAAVLIRLPPSDLVAAARSGRRLDHIVAALIKSQLRRSTTAGAAVHSINHSDVATI